MNSSIALFSWAWELPLVLCLRMLTSAFGFSYLILAWENYPILEWVEDTKCQALYFALYLFNPSKLPGTYFLYCIDKEMSIKNR